MKEQGLYKKVMSSIEKPLLEDMLSKVGGNQWKAARLLGINRNTLRAKIKKLRIDVSLFKDNWKGEIV